MNVVLVGYGNMGKRHAAALDKMPDVNFVVAEPDDTRWSSPDGTTYRHFVRTFKDALQYNDPIAVIIASPTPTHATIVREALEAGLAVFVEKPMSLPNEANSLRYKAMEHSDLPFMVGYIERFNPAVVELKKWLTSFKEHGEKVIHIETQRSGFTNLDPNRGPVAVDLATHDVDVIGHLVGYPDRVFAAGNGDHIHATFTFGPDSEMTASINADWISPEKVRTLRVVCGNGVFDVDYLARSLVWQAIGFEREVIALPVADPLADELNHFLACIDTGFPPVPGVHEGWRANRVVEAIIESAKRRSPVLLGRDY